MAAPQMHIGPTPGRLPHSAAIAFATLTIAGIAGLCVALAPASSASWLLVVGNGLIAAYPFVRRSSGSSKSASLLSPERWFCIAFGVLFFLRPLFDLTNPHGIPSFVGIDPTPGYVKALAIAFVGGLAFLSGFHLSVGTQIAKKLPLCPENVSMANSRVYVALLLVVAIVGYGAFLGRAGGVATLRAVLIGRNVASGLAIASSSGYLYSALQLLGPAGFLALALAPRWKSTQGIAGFALLAVSLLPHLGAGDRSTVLPVLLSLVILYYLRRNSQPRLKTWLLLALPLFILFIVVPNNYRNSDYRDRRLTSEIVFSMSNPMAGVRTVFEGLDTAMISGFSVELQTVPDAVPYQLGRTYLEALTRPIPRAIWPAKPRSADEVLVEYLWPSLARQGIGFSFSFFGEPYFNLGIFGVLAVSLLFGVAWKVLYFWFGRDTGNPIAMAIYAVSLPFLLVYMRGGLGVDYQRQVIAVLPILVAIPFISRTNLQHRPCHTN